LSLAASFNSAFSFIFSANALASARSCAQLVELGINKGHRQPKSSIALVRQVFSVKIF
jgi:hypothetical protein